MTKASQSKSKSRDVEDEGAGEESPQEALEAMILEPTQDSINRVIDGVISNALDVVCSFVKVLQCKGNRNVCYARRRG